MTIKPARTRSRKASKGKVAKRTKQVKAKVKARVKAKVPARKAVPSKVVAKPSPQIRPALDSWPSKVASVAVPVDTSVYPREAVYGAAYAFLDRAYVHLAKGAEGAIEVRLTGKAPLGAEGLRRLGGEFLNELLNQLLRVSLDESGRKVREYIVAKAHFFQDQGGHQVQKLIDSAMQGAFDEDPLDIAVPWEEKYGDRGSGKC